MKQKTMVLIALAVVCGLGASFMTSKLLADRQTQEETIKVLVARTNLATGIIIRKPEEQFEEKEVLKETAPKNVLTKFEDVKGRQLKIPRRQGDTISQDDMYSDKGNDLMYNLPPGHRAVGIRVSSEQVAAGFAAVPHSRIDIACAVRSGDDRQAGTRICLQNVLVLASGTATVRDDQGKAMPCDVVTVALKPEDCLKLETIKGKGSLTMFLRPFGENATVDPGFVNVERAFRSTTGSDKNSEGDDNPKVGSGAPAVLPEVVAEKGVKLEEKPPVDDKQVVRITNGDDIKKWTYERDADGFYSARIEPVVVEAVTPKTSTPTNKQTSSTAPSTSPTQKPRPNAAW
jgi:Flp pilus assembly protein CpaB